MPLFPFLYTVKAIVFLLILCPSLASGFVKQDSAAKNKRFEYGFGVSVQFLLYADKNESVLGHFISQPYPGRNAQGPGMSLFLGAYTNNGLGFEYSPTLRYAYIRLLHMRNSNGQLIGNGPVERSFVLDHHFSLVYRKNSTGKRPKYFGIGYSIISTNKGYEGAFLIQGNAGAVLTAKYINLEFSGFHALARFEIMDHLSIEPRFLYVPPGNIEYRPENTFSIFSLLSVRYSI